MGNRGFIYNVTQFDYIYINSYNVKNKELMDVCSDCLHHGIDWVYTSVQTMYTFDLRVWYMSMLETSFDESFDWFFYWCWFKGLYISSVQLFWNAMLDIYNNSLLFKFPFSDSWFRGILFVNESTYLYLYNPELIFIKNKVLSELFYLNLSSLNFVLYNTVESETFYSPIILPIQFLVLIFFASLFIIFYFSFFTSYTMEENVIDMDYLVANGTVESEKEISSLDDMILVLIVLVYVFGWYFYIHFWSAFSMFSSITLVFYLFPALYYVIIGIPTFLIYDFGIYFLAYLKGVANSSMFLFELLFDYIAVVIFYTRILVQAVRLVLMIFTYVSMHDLVLYFKFKQKMFIGYESLWETFSSLPTTLDSFSYFFLFILPGKFIYWIYEILHTYFVVTVQFIAFFAIVFWLFLFLYTFFVFEKQENYFTEKREKRKSTFNKLYLLK